MLDGRIVCASGVQSTLDGGNVGRARAWSVALTEAAYPRWAATVMSRWWRQRS